MPYFYTTLKKKVFHSILALVFVNTSYQFFVNLNLLFKVRGKIGHSFPLSCNKTHLR